MSDSQSTTAWVTVADAAEKAQVDSGTIRQWYRAGRIPTRRAEGGRGAFLVPLELVLSLADPAEGLDVRSPGASVEDSERRPDVDATTRVASEEELAEVRAQLEFLRAQLAEVSSENRALKQELQDAGDQRADLRRQLADAVDDRKGVESRLATVEAELTQLRRTAARSSITDNSWLDQQTPAYQSPVRRQAMAPPPPSVAASSATPPDGGPTAPFEARTSELSGLLAATRADGSPGVEDLHDEEAREAEPHAEPSRFADEYVLDGDAEYTASRAIWTDETPHPPLGEHDDDLLPHPDKKGRRGRK